MNYSETGPVVVAKLRRAPSVPFWTNINADRICSGKEVRLFAGMHVNIIGGTTDRPLVQAFYPGARPCYAWVMPADLEILGAEGK